MGVNCTIDLPPSVRVDYVAMAIGVLSGLTPEKAYFGSGSDGGWAARVPGVDVQPVGRTSPGMVDITIAKPHRSSPLIDGEVVHSVFYFFESSDDNGKPVRSLNPPSTAYWISVGRALIRLFGGKIDFSDTDDVDVNEKRPAWKHNNASDGEPWYELQNRIMNIKPLTEKDLDANVKHAAYGDWRRC